MYHTHTPAEWASMVCMAASGYAAFSAPYFLLVDASRSDFDPRPTVHRALESGRVDPLLIAVANAKYDVRLSLRDAAVWLAALLMLLSSASEATR
jgi:hypothetical protein